MVWLYQAYISKINFELTREKSPKSRGVLWYFCLPVDHINIKHHENYYVFFGFGGSCNELWKQ